MTTEDMEFFSVIARSANLTDAAAKLFISQPALSKRLNALESKVGTQLVLRSKGMHQLTLTAAGKALLPLAEKMCAIGREISEVKLAAQKIRFSISAVGTISEYVLGPAVHDFVGKYPNVWLEVTRNMSPECYDWVSRDMSALGFIAETQYYPGIETQLAYREPMVLLGSRHSTFRDGMSPDELSPDNEILVSWNREYMQWRNYWYGDSAPRVSLWLLSMAEQFLRQEGCWSIAPLTMAESYCRRWTDMRYWSLSSPPSDRILYIIKRAGVEHECTRPFLEMVHRQLDEVYGIHSLLL